MRCKLLAQALRGCAFAAVLALAGCTAATTSTTTIAGKNLSIYISDPTELASNPAAQDVVDAEQLACSQLKGEVRSFNVSCLTLRQAKISANARAAIVDPAAIAYLGEVVPGSSAESLGITNSQDLLQVSPTDSAVALTRSTPAVPGSPGRYYESLSTYGHTFARMVPSSSREAVALVSEMESLGIKQVRVVGDHSDYGQELAQDLVSRGVVSASSTDALLYAGSSRAAAARTLNRAVSTNPKLKLFVPSPLADQGFAATLSTAAQKALYAVSPGLPAGDSGARSFISQFRTSYGHQPATQAIFGYAAVQAVFHVLAQARSSAANRATVVKDFTRLRYAGSVLGSFSIDKNGDTSFVSFVSERVKSGRLVPVAPVSG